MIGELIALWFMILWGISAFLMWVAKATFKASAWLILAPFRFWKGYKREAARQNAQN